jgi:hypothetical protein
MRITYFIFIFITFCASSIKSYAAEPDFYLKVLECSSIIASSVKLDFPLKIMEGDKSQFACSRSSKKVTCKLVFENNAKSLKGGNLFEYDIELEAGTKLDLTLSPSGGDYIAIDRATHSAIIITRVFGDNFGGAKVCRGMFLTSDEFKEFNK